jgi:DNA-binding response OmpR family regulator
MHVQKILLVEDDKTIALGLDYSLGQEGFFVTVCYDVASALSVLDENFSLIILDLSLPDGSGYDVCKAVKSTSDVPVIFLTACDDEVNVVMGLDMGADDYITKPFRIRELVSRIKTVLRRYRKNMDVGSNGKADSARLGRTEVSLGNVLINTAQAKVYKRNIEIMLTALEYRLLLTLLNNEGQVLSRSQLLEGIWDIAGDFVNDNTLSVYIKRLREKIEDDPQYPQLIHTVRGLGYRAGE